MTPCPPPVVEDAAPVEGEPLVQLPQSTARWFLDRDVYAVDVLACYHRSQASVHDVEAERDAALWRAETAEAQVQRLRTRPTWGAVAGAAGAGIVGGALLVVLAR